MTTRTDPPPWEYLADRGLWLQTETGLLFDSTGRLAGSYGTPGAPQGVVEALDADDGTDPYGDVVETAEGLAGRLQAALERLGLRGPLARWLAAMALGFGIAWGLHEEELPPFDRDHVGHVEVIGEE